MSNSLGDRIKTLRKELKMTQTDLAGSEMTKSMLSQIENNLAMPSMKNLQYIASKLGKPMSYFLEDGEFQGSLPLEEIHQELKSISGELIRNAPQEALLKFESMLQKYNFDHESKIYADFLDRYSGCLINLNRIEEAQLKIKEVVEIYKAKFMFVDAARAYLTLMDIYWNKFDYHKCMDILEEALEIYENSISKDKAFEIEVNYIKALLYGGIDRLEDCVAATQEAIKTSKETDIYYKSDELYRTIAVISVFLGNPENFDYNIEKATQFAVFTENNRELGNIEATYGLYANREGKYREAIEHLEKAIKLSDGILPFAHTEKGKSLYMLKEYEEALDTLKNVKFPNRTPFKYDYLHLCSSKVYEGLCLNKLQKFNKAIEAINIGINKMEIVGISKYLAHAYKSLSEVYSDMGDFEKAFTTLKKANEIDEEAKQQKLYY